MRLLLVEDHPLVAAGLRSILASEHEVLLAPNGGVSHFGIRRSLVDLVLLDLGLRHRSAAKVLMDLRALPAPPRLLGFALHEDPTFPSLLQEQGAQGFVGAWESLEVVRLAVDTIGAGGTWFPPPEKGRSRPRWSSRTPQLRLTTRQMDVLHCVGDGLSRKAIASRLEISIYTVDEHLAALRRLFGVATNSALIRAAVNHGFLPPFRPSFPKIDPINAAPLRILGSGNP